MRVDVLSVWSVWMRERIVCQQQSKEEWAYLSKLTTSQPFVYVRSKKTVHKFFWVFFCLWNWRWYKNLLYEWEPRLFCPMLPLLLLLHCLFSHIFYHLKTILIITNTILWYCTIISWIIFSFRYYSIAGNNQNAKFDNPAPCRNAYQLLQKRRHSPRTPVSTCLDFLNLTEMLVLNTRWNTYHHLSCLKKKTSPKIGPSRCARNSL